MNKLKQEFLIGFGEGWSAFWSPFVGLYKAIAATWHRHVNSHKTVTTHRHA